jgi:MoxR-like ATPase
MAEFPLLLIILGTPASGKTTLARALALELEYPCFCKAPRFLELPGPRWVYPSDVQDAYRGLLEELKSWGL